MPLTALAAVVLTLLTLTHALGSDRVKVIPPPHGQEVAKDLVESLEAACNQGDFMAFMDHFTPAHRARIRRHMENIFVKHEPHMEILKVTLLSETDDAITFGVRYAWHDSDEPEEVFASRVVARRSNGTWKLDGEKVKEVARSADQRSEADGVVPAAFNPFNPPADQIDPDLEHLRGDIGIRPGQGCANGRCGR